MTEQNVLDLIFEELRKAEKKHPTWPEDLIYASTNVVEEAGELLQATKEYHEEPHLGTTQKDMIKEAAQTGAMAIRFLMNLQD